MIIKKVYSLQFTVYSLFFLLLTVNCSLYTICHAQEVISSTELIEMPQEYDGEEVAYEGEVIGDIMKRRSGAWVNINDGYNSIGVWMTPKLAGVIEHRGSYKSKGDILRVKGIFHRACPQHGGDLDIHAASVRKIKSGWLREEKIIPAKQNLLIILIVILCLILILRILINR
jgi:hypothetical protein